MSGVVIDCGINNTFIFTIVVLDSLLLVSWSGNNYVVGNDNTLCEKGQVDTEEECIKAAKELGIEYEYEYILVEP